MTFKPCDLFRIWWPVPKLSLARAVQAGDNESLVESYCQLRRRPKRQPGADPMLWSPGGRVESVAGPATESGLQDGGSPRAIMGILAIPSICGWITRSPGFRPSDPSDSYRRVRWTDFYARTELRQCPGVFPRGGAPDPASLHRCPLGEKLARQTSTT